MSVNARIYNYFTSNQTQSYQVNEERIGNLDIDNKIQNCSNLLENAMSKKQPKYENIKIKINGKVEDITRRANKEIPSKLRNSGVDESQILEVMTFVNKELSEISSPLIEKGLPATHSSKVSSSGSNLEIIIDHNSSIPPDIKVRISNITSRIFNSPPKAVQETYEYSEPLYMFNGQITYTPKSNKLTSTGKLASGQKPSIISRLMAKILSFLDVIFRL